MEKNDAVQNFKLAIFQKKGESKAKIRYQIAVQLRGKNCE